MPNKRTKNVSKTLSSSKNQTSISKYFVTDSQYPTSALRKRSATVGKNISSAPLEKVPKLDEAIEKTSCLEKSQISEFTSKELQSFRFRKTNHDKSQQVSSPISNYASSRSVAENILTAPSNTFPVGPFCVPDHFDATEEMDQIPNDSSTSLNKPCKYTPLEKQYLEFKDKYPDVILMIECGYKYRFFGEDAEIASKVLNIGCYKQHNFMSAIIPVPRLHYHVRRLVMQGYKVGVVKQTESAALKAAGEKRNELFSRELAALYTKSTLIGEEFTTALIENTLDTTETVDLDMGSGYLVCVYEEPSANNKQAFNIALVGVQVSSGDMTYTTFQDNPIRNKLETSLIHINPSEILLPSHLSKETEKLINNFKLDRSARTEIIPQHLFEHSFALDNLSEFYQAKSSQNESLNSQGVMQIILALPTLVVSCLSALIVYLTQFKLESILKTLSNLNPLSTLDHMILNATTLKSLEILRNNSSYSVDCSLFWVLNKTITKFGERLLKFWVGNPLKDLNLIEERLNIVTEILYSESIVYKVVESILRKLPDLEKILCCVFYHKCSCFDFLKLLQAFTKIHTDLLSITDKISVEVEVPRLKLVLSDIPELLKGVDKFLSNLDSEAAREGEKTKVFINASMYPELQKCRDEISTLEMKLNNLRPGICQTLRLINFKYTAVAGQKYLIEVPNDNIRLVPINWVKISSTKQVSRFRSPEILKLYNQLQLQKELMINHANAAWSTFLNEFGTDFNKYKRVVSHLAEFDCYLSLAKVAKEENYCRPYFKVEGNKSFNVIQGRHPILTKALGEENQFVANDINMDSINRCIVVTGPNMGGKSTYVRQTALISVMAQIGSYVPADSATMPLFDSIYVRMGGDDDLVHGRSTFMTEMSETSEILANISAKSFVILDELGRGTSTNDGTAIAYATLEHLISEVQCFTMFVTHYPAILELKLHYPNNISTVHMGYILKDNATESDIETVTFLYNVVTGLSKKSYGINVAALAGIPKEILSEAHKKSQAIEMKGILQRKIREFMKKVNSSSSNIQKLGLHQNGKFPS